MKTPDATLLDALRSGSIDGAVRVLKGIHDAKKAAPRGDGARERRRDAAHDLVFALAQAQAGALQSVLGVYHAASEPALDALSEALGFALGAPRSEGPSTEEDDVLDALRAAQAALVRHPAAAQAIFTALVREGRRYAKTPEGAATREALARSELVRRGRVLWEVATLNVLEDQPEGVLPSKVVDAIARATRAPDLERMLARLFRLEADDDPRAP